MAIDRAEIERLAILARIGLTEEETELFENQLSHILEQFEILQALDTSGIIPTGHAADLTSVMRDDTSGASLSARQVLANAPRIAGDLIRVNPMLEE